MWIKSHSLSTIRHHIISPPGYQSPTLGDSGPVPRLQEAHQCVTLQLRVTTSTLSCVPRPFASVISSTWTHREVNSQPRISHLLFACCFLVMCHLVCCLSLCVTCLHVSLSSHVVVQRCQWVVVLGICSCSLCWAFVTIHAWWCGHSVVSWSGGVIVVVHRVAHSPFPSAHVTYMAWALGSLAIWCAPSSWGCKQG